MPLLYWDMKKIKWDYISYFMCCWDKSSNKKQPKEEIIYFGSQFMVVLATRHHMVGTLSFFSILDRPGGQTMKCLLIFLPQWI